jgi:hypothetical protein
VEILCKGSPSFELVILRLFLSALLGLVGPELLLDRGGCLDLLLRNLIFVELIPEIFELGGVLLQVVGVVHDEKIFLVVCAGLECPVE